jgi:tRNA(Ile)-lysidine synthase TilS/MesJ
VGLSGGKDSLTLLTLLAALSHFYPHKFEVTAATIDMGFLGADFSPLARYCEKLGVPFLLKQSNLAEVIFDIRKEKNPCSLCAKMRRGALNDIAKECGCNKVALGHHNDDAVETFYLSLFYEGRISCFSPVTYLSRSDITQIRPMIYIPEKEIIGFARKNALPVAKNPCPANQNTKRQYIKDLLKQLQRENHGLKERTFGAIQRGNIAGFSDKNPCILPPSD